LEGSTSPRGGRNFASVFDLRLNFYFFDALLPAKKIYFAIINIFYHDIVDFRVHIQNEFFFPLTMKDFSTSAKTLWKESYMTCNCYGITSFDRIQKKTFDQIMVTLPNFC
jgi:hypothetical protein